MKALILSLLLFCGLAHGQTVIGLHTLSAHIPQHDQMNQNWGAYIRHGWVEAGLYRNSHSRTSAYLSGQYNLLRGKYGSLDLQAGLAYGYQKKCSTTTHHTTEVVEKKTFDNRDTSTTTKPAVTTVVETCSGFSKGALTPLAGFNYTLPFSILGATPRVQMMPGFKDASSVVHLSIEYALK